MKTVVHLTLAATTALTLLMPGVAPPERLGSAPSTTQRMSPPDNMTGRPAPLNSHSAAPHGSAPHPTGTASPHPPLTAGAIVLVLLGCVIAVRRRLSQPRS